MTRPLVVEQSEGSFHSGIGPAIAHSRPRSRSLFELPLTSFQSNPQSGAELTGELEGYRSSRYRPFTAWMTLKRQSKYS